MVENYFWQFFDIMWLVLLLSQINTVCHCRFTVTAPRSQEAWSKNQRRRSFKPWSSLASLLLCTQERGDHASELTLRLETRICVPMDMLSLTGLPTPIVCSLPHCWLKHAQARWCQLLSLMRVLSRLARHLRSGENCQCFAFTCQAQ